MEQHFLKTANEGVGVPSSKENLGSGENAFLPTTDLPMVLTVEEFAELLRIARASAYRAVRAGEVPGVVRVGKTLRINRDTVLRWLEQGCVPLSRRKKTA